MKQIIFFILILPVAFSCRSREERKVERAFYYWKSSFRLDTNDYKALDSLKVKTLYVKFYDVVWDDIHRAMPVASLDRSELQQHQYKKKEHQGRFKIIPVVFITNEAIERSKEEEMKVLSERIHNKILVMCGFMDCGPPEEIQIDCDWNGTTREKYFMLLKMLKGRMGANTISATIRLHQVKYHSKTGVPPVDKGMLMFYNVAPVYKPDVKNSILDTKEAARYVHDTIRYPLELDVALPIFSWGVLFRGNQFKGLVNYMDKKRLKALGFFTETRDYPGVYRCTRDTVYDNYYFRKGDLLRLEEVDIHALEEAKTILEPLIKKDSLTITLFHWDSTLVNRYDHEAFNKIFRSYK